MKTQGRLGARAREIIYNTVQDWLGAKRACEADCLRFRQLGYDAEATTEREWAEAYTELIEHPFFKETRR